MNLAAFLKAEQGLDTPLREKASNDIMAEIHKLAKTKTILLISHRLANVVQADNIYVLENGCVAESGSHKELLNHHGLYERPWDAQ